MTGVAWERVWAVFEAALDEPPEQRAAYLDEACDGDAVLRRAVDGMLAADGAGGTVLDEPALDVARSQAKSAGESATGSRSKPRWTSRSQNSSRSNVSPARMVCTDSRNTRRGVILWASARGVATTTPGSDCVK